MPFSLMLRRVALVRSDVSEERIVTIIKVRRIGELGTMLAITSKRNSLGRYTGIILQCATVADYRFHVPSSSCHPDYGGVALFRNVGSYKSHTL
jgi:hypothetical protein